MNTRICPADISPDCPGHQGWERLRDCLVEALYWSNHNDTTGTVDWDVWAGLVIQDDQETIPHPQGGSVTIPAGTYVLITEDDQGNVTCTEYPTADQAQAAFDTIERQYGLWCEEQDRREQEIMITHGRIGW